MHEVLVNRLGGLSLPRKSVVRLTDRPDMTLDVYHGRKTTIQYNTIQYKDILHTASSIIFVIHLLKEGLPYLFHSFRNKYFYKISLGNMLYFQNKL